MSKQTQEHLQIRTIITQGIIRFLTLQFECRPDDFVSTDSKSESISRIQRIVLKR